jgi:signal transduction histidine kinase
VLAVADGDYGRHTEVKSTGEIEELAKAFNHMSARLLLNRQEIEEQHGQIMRFNEELQERVDRRTQQLVDTQRQLLRSGQLAAVAEVGAGLAHELNNPLSAILGVAQVLRRSPDGQGRDALLEDLELQAQRCRSVVGAMLRFSSGEVDPLHAPVVDLREVLADVTTLVEGPFRQRGVTLSLKTDDAPLHVRVDPVHASRILAQILNGLRAWLMDGAELVISATQNGSEIEVVMRPDLPVALDEFRRDDWMASGMGLWVARRLLDQLGGRLEQPVKVPLVSALKPPQTEEYMDDPSLPLLQDATWRVVFPAAST